MKILADLHTHSINSRLKHGKNTIEEMALEANEIGLVEIAITDHGYSHFFRTTKQKLKQARKLIDEINTWSKTKVLLGIEADIVSENGDLDIDNETLSMLDILIVGYHKMIFTDFANFFGKTKKTEEAKRKCTNAFVNAINRYPVTIVSHLDSVLTTDLYEIGKACRERGTMVEINNRHTKWNEKQMQDLLDSGCMFVVSSDAHSRNQVGRVDRAMEYITKYNIPSERVANVEFLEEEKSEIDRQYSAYRSVYEQITKQKKEREAIIENKRRTEITGNLSSEMEKALKDIAAQKGLHYEERQKERVEEDYVRPIGDEDLDLIRQAEEYIKRQELQNIQNENESLSKEIEETESELLSFDDNHPLLKDAFKDKFQSINNVVKQTETQEKSETNNIEELKSNQINKNSNASTYEQLTSSSLSQSDMQGLKNIMAGSSPREDVKLNNVSSKPETQVVKNKVEPEDFMGSITQTRLSKNAETTNKSAQTTSSQVAKKAVSKTGKRGGFIAVNSLIDEE